MKVTAPGSPRRPRISPPPPHAQGGGHHRGSDGPTAIIYGHQIGELHAACSSLHFEPVKQVEWRIVFHEQRMFLLQEIDLFSR